MNDTFNPDDLASKIDYEGGIMGGALGYYAEFGPEGVPEDISTAWRAAYEASATLQRVLEKHGALL
jgi:hypothetical protein